MAEFVSDVKTIPYNESDIFPILSDLSKLELVKDKIPQDKVKEFAFDRDSCTAVVDPIGKIKFNIIERIPNTTVKFEAEKVPFGLNLWIQLKQVAENDTKMKITVRADLNPFLKPMVSKPLQEGLDKIADMLATLPYGEINKENH